MAARQLSKADTDGTTLGQSATDKVGFHGAAPSAQGAAITNAAVDAASAIAQLNLLLAVMRTKGIIAT